MNRRDFLQRSLIATAGLYFYPLNSFAQQDDEHFYLRIITQGGLDPSYLFDARPLALTTANLMQNYLNEEPEIISGKNGTETYATSLTKPLAPFLDYFSIINGVIMVQGFDGHEQSLNMLFTGNPFGGESYLPDLNFQAANALDGVQFGTIFGLGVNNHSKVITFNPESAKSFIQKVQSSSKVDFNNNTYKQIASRMHTNSNGDGRFSLAAKNMYNSYLNIPELTSKIDSIDIGTIDQDKNNPQEVTPEAKIIKLVQQLYLKKISKSAIIILSTEQNIDTHDADSASKQPELFRDIVSKLVNYFTAMKNTEFANGKNMFDTTTVEVCSEFGRTMRQIGPTIDKTGTDHNPLSNSILIGGKGIRGGMVLGQSDFRTSTEKLSGAHLQLDSSKLKLIGRPFDFKTYTPADQLPEKFALSDYLSYHSVTNTIFSAFNVDQKKYRKLDRNSSTFAPVLRTLLK